MPHIKEGNLWTVNPKKLHDLVEQESPGMAPGEKNNVIAIYESTVRNNGNAITVEPDKNYVNFKNGQYNLETSEFRSYPEKYICISMLACDYEPDAPDCDEFADNFLTTLSDDEEETVQKLWEMTGYTLPQRNSRHRSFMLLGGARTGKSVWLKVLERLVGEDMYAVASLDELNEPNVRAGLVGKSLCVVDEVSTKIHDITAFKSLTSGGSITAKILYKDMFKFAYSGIIVMGTNRIPKIFDEEMAIMERIIIIPCRRMPISEDERVEDLDAELVKHSGYITKKALKAYQGVMQHKKFYKNDLSVSMTSNAYEDDNPHMDFIANNLTVDMLEKASSTRIYEKYLEWARDTYIRYPVTQKTFIMGLGQVYRWDYFRPNVPGVGRVRGLKNVRRIKGKDPKIEEFPW
jgi:putative DNA primase/helicase